jgi:hypothetical protein
MFMIVAKQIFMKKVRVREKEEKTAKKENLLSACGGGTAKNAGKQNTRLCLLCSNK